MIIEQLLSLDIGLKCRVDGWVTDSRASAFYSCHWGPCSQINRPGITETGGGVLKYFPRRGKLCTKSKTWFQPREAEDSLKAVMNTSSQIDTRSY